MKIKKITVNNLKAVSDMTADFNGCTAIVTGGNNKGKTTFLRGLIDRLKWLKPDMIVRQGEKEMSSEMELTSGEKFLWAIDDKGRETLQLVTESDLKISVTKAIAEKYFPVSFDIDIFLNETPKKQREMLQKLCGLDFSAIDAQYRSAFDERTFLGRKKEEEKAKCVVIDETLPPAPVPTEGLQKELHTIDLHNEKYEKARTAAVEISEDIFSHEREIAEMERIIEAKKETLKALEQRKANGQKWLADKANHPQENKAEIQAKIKESEKLNEKVAENIKGIEQKTKAEKAESEWKACDEKVKSIQQQRIDMIKTANLPDGLAFTDDGIEIDGMSVTKEQLSSSKIYITALKLASMNIGNVRTLHFDASHLDKVSLAEIEAWANENDLQLLIERPDFEGGEITYQILQS